MPKLIWRGLSYGNTGQRWFEAFRSPGRFVPRVSLFTILDSLRGPSSVFFRISTEFGIYVSLPSLLAPFYRPSAGTLVRAHHDPSSTSSASSSASTLGSIWSRMLPTISSAHPPPLRYRVTFNPPYIIRIKTASGSSSYGFFNESANSIRFYRRNDP